MSVYMLNAAMLNVILLSVILLSVVACFNYKCSRSLLCYTIPIQASTSNRFRSFGRKQFGRQTFGRSGIKKRHEVEQLQP
jgi:hypothetical protein